MKEILLFISGIIILQISKAQTPNLEWVKSMGGNSTGKSISVDTSGDVYTAGDTASNVFISKLDGSGNIIWTKNLRGMSASFSTGQSIALDADENIYVTGCFMGTIDFDPGAGIVNLTSAGGRDVFVLKLNPSGDFVWAKAMGGGSEDEGASVKADESANIYLTGYFTDTADFNPGTGISNLISAGISNIFLLKLDVDGNFIWAKSIGGSSDDSGASIALDSSDNIYVTGYFRDTVDFNPGVGVVDLACGTDATDLFILKLEGSGNFVWAKNMDGGNASGSSIAVDALGNTYTTGEYLGTVDFDPGSGIFNLSGIFGNIFILKLDPFGNFSWVKSMDGSAVGLSIALDASNGVYTTGCFSGTVDFDPGPETSFITYSPTGVGCGDMFVSKLDDSGNFVWAIDAGGTATGFSIALDQSYNVYTTGWFFGTVDFDPGAGVADLAVGSGEFTEKLSQVATSINEYPNTDQIIMYPNPTNGNMTLKYVIKQNDMTVFSIYDTMGKEIEAYTLDVNSDQLQITNLNLQNGIYFYRMIVNGRTIKSGKIVIISVQ